MSIVDIARNIAIEYHAGDRNKHDGEMYLLHLSRVYENVREADGIEVCQAIAWLHDVLEDTSLTYSELELRITPHLDTYNVITAVDALTKRKGETNVDYYNRVKANPFARFVKLKGDIVDNVRRNHKIKDEATRLRMGQKYSLGIDILSYS